MKYYVKVTKKAYHNGIGISYWKSFDSRISALLFAKVNGYKLIAKGK